MAIIDKSLEFSDGQALTATAASTDTIDFGSDRSMSSGDPLYVVVNVKVAPVGTGTYSVQIQTDDNSAFSSATTVATLTIPATAVAGQTFTAMLPIGNERHVRLNYVLGGTNPAVTLNAYLSPEQPSTYRAYPDGI